MILARMIKVDEESLICDLAETYQIYQYKEWPPLEVAIFAKGLRGDSRIKMKMSKEKVPTEIVLLSSLVDSMNLLLWSKTKDGWKGVNRPTSLVDAIRGHSEENKVMRFESGKDFETARNNILKGG